MSELSMSPEEQNIEYWKGIVDTKLVQYADALARLFSKTDEIETTLTGISTNISSIQSDLNSISTAVTKIEDRQKQLDEQKPAAIDLANGTVTFKWLREKFGVPLILGGLVLFFFTIMPTLFAIIYLLPQIVERVFPAGSGAPIP